MSSPTCTIVAPPRWHASAPTPPAPTPPTFGAALRRLFAGLALLR